MSGNPVLGDRSFPYGGPTADEQAYMSMTSEQLKAWRAQQLHQAISQRYSYPPAGGGGGAHGSGGAAGYGAPSYGGGTNYWPTK